MLNALSDSVGRHLESDDFIDLRSRAVGSIGTRLMAGLPTSRRARGDSRPSCPAHPISSTRRRCARTTRARRAPLVHRRTTCLRGSFVAPAMHRLSSPRDRSSAMGCVDIPLGAQPPVPLRYTKPRAPTDANPVRPGRAASSFSAAFDARDGGVEQDPHGRTARAGGVLLSRLRRSRAHRRFNLEATRPVACAQSGAVSAGRVGSLVWV